MMKAKFAFSGMVVPEGARKPREVVYEAGDEVEDNDPAVAEFPEYWEQA